MFGFELPLLFGKFDHRFSRFVARDVDAARRAFAFDRAEQVAHFGHADVFARFDRQQNGRDFVFRLARVGNAVNAFVRAFFLVNDGAIVRISENRPFFKLFANAVIYESARQPIPYLSERRAVRPHQALCKN